MKWFLPLWKELSKYTTKSKVTSFQHLKNLTIPLIFEIFRKYFRVFAQQVQNTALIKILLQDYGCIKLKEFLEIDWLVKRIESIWDSYRSINSQLSVWNQHLSFMKILCFVIFGKEDKQNLGTIWKFQIKTSLWKKYMNVKMSIMLIQDTRDHEEKMPWNLYYSRTPVSIFVEL